MLQGCSHACFPHTLWGRAAVSWGEVLFLRDHISKQLPDTHLYPQPPTPATRPQERYVYSETRQKTLASLKSSICCTKGDVTSAHATVPTREPHRSTLKTCLSNTSNVHRHSVWQWRHTSQLFCCVEILFMYSTLIWKVNKVRKTHRTKNTRYVKVLQGQHTLFPYKCCSIAEN